jgi:hypothetical protein
MGMSKFSGNIGFAETAETVPGVYREQLTVRKYRGDLLSYNRKLQSSGQVNDDVNISNEISIVADPYANTNIFAMRYIEFIGAKWKITNVRVERPRLILTIGGVYNE